MRSLTRVAAALMISMPLPLHAQALPQADNAEPPSISLASVTSGETLHLASITVGPSFDDQKPVEVSVTAHNDPGSTMHIQQDDSSYIKQYAQKLCDQEFGNGQFQYLDRIVTAESGWNYRATEAHTGAYGLGQALPASKMLPFGEDYRTNPVTQLRWLMSYIAGRYGSPATAWQFHLAHNWY